MSTAGCVVDVPAFAPPDTPAPAEAGGVATEPPPITPPDVPVLVPWLPVDTPAPAAAPPPAEPEVCACAIDMMEAHAIARAMVLVIGVLRELMRAVNTPA